MRVVTQAQPGFCGECICGAVWHPTHPIHNTMQSWHCSCVCAQPKLVPELVGWLAGCLAVLCSCQRQSLLLGSVVSRYGDLARTKMGAKNTHELWDMKFESVAVPD